MEGNILVKGNLYLTEGSNAFLKKSGLTVHARKDVILVSKRDKITLGGDDVFIEDLFEKLNVKDVVAFSKLSMN